MTDIVILDNGKLTIISSENRGDFRSLMGRENYTTEVIGNIHENQEQISP